MGLSMGFLRVFKWFSMLFGWLFDVFFFSVALLWFFYDFPVFFVFDGFAMVPIWLNDVKCGCLMVPMII